MPRLRAASRNGAICLAMTLTRAVAPLHQCRSHMSQTMMAVVAGAMDCLRLTSRQSPVPLKISTRERRSTVASPTPARIGKAKNTSGSQRDEITRDMLSRSETCGVLAGNPVPGRLKSGKHEHFALGAGFQLAIGVNDLAEGESAG